MTATHAGESESLRGPVATDETLDCRHDRLRAHDKEEVPAGKRCELRARYPVVHLASDREQDGAVAPAVQDERGHGYLDKPESRVVDPRCIALSGGSAAIVTTGIPEHELLPAGALTCGLVPPREFES